MSAGSVPVGLVQNAKEQCFCESHCVLHPVSGVYPLCVYNEQVELAVNSKGQTSYMVPKPPEPDKEVVMEDGGFFIEKVPDKQKIFDKHESYIMHYCPSLYWKCHVDEVFMIAHGVCSHCMGTIPSGLIALWKLHNWQYIQDGISSTTEACSA